MARQQFEMIVAQAPREKLVQRMYNNTTTVLAGQKEVVYVFPAVNTVAELVGLYINAPVVPTAVSGNHETFVGYDTDGSVERIYSLYAKSNYNTAICFNFSQWWISDVASFPNTAEAQGSAMRGFRFDSLVGIMFEYFNNTTVSQTAKRDYNLQYLQREVRI